MALSALALLLFAAGEQTSEPERTLLVPIVVRGEQGGVEVGAVRRAVEQAVRGRTGLELLSEEQLFVAEPEDWAKRVSDCGDDDSCFLDQLGVYRARWVLLVVVNSQLTPPIVAVRLFDADRRTAAGDISGALKADELDAGAAVRARAEQLLDQIGQRVTPVELAVVPAAAEPTGLLASPWFWLGAGALAALGLGLTTLLLLHPGETCICAGPPGSVCADCSAP